MLRINHHNEHRKQLTRSDYFFVKFFFHLVPILDCFLSLRVVLISFIPYSRTQINFQVLIHVLFWTEYIPSSFSLAWIVDLWVLTSSSRINRQFTRITSDIRPKLWFGSQHWTRFFFLLPIVRNFSCAHILTRSTDMKRVISVTNFNAQFFIH